MIGLTRARTLAVAGLAGLATACASPESDPPVLEPSPEAATEAAADVSSETTVEAGKDADAESPSPDVVDAALDADAAVEAEACVPEEAQDAADGPCTKGTVEKQWCGACGRKQRFCGNDGQWKPWSECLEDELAVCTQCETREVSCGTCGKRVVSCETSQSTCRWVLGECSQTGECAAGDYEIEPAGCPDGRVHLRQCSDACAWGQPGPCEIEPGWDPLPQAPISARESFASVAAGSKWFVWGGVGSAGHLDDGAVFDSASNAWEMLPSATWPDGDSDAGQTSLRARSQVAIAWTGTDVMMFGGIGANDEVFGDGARWTASSGWAGLSAEGSPSKRRSATAIWADGPGVVIVWGGQSPFGGAASGGGRYSPSIDVWQSVSAAPFGARQGHVAVWDPVHARMIIWGGAGDVTAAPERSGAAYDPLTDTWSPIADAPIRRRNAFAFWDPGSERVVVILGNDGSWPGPRGDGAAYDPSSDSWALLPELAMTGYLPGWGEAAAFGNGRAWVTGGDASWASGYTAMGARYESTAGQWGKLPALPDARAGHAAVWLEGVLVWGGKGPAGLLSSGARLRDSSLWP